MIMNALPLSSPEFIKVTADLRLSYPNVCVLFMDKIENKTLTDSHDAFVRMGSSVVEGFGWHGTHPDNINSISENGFNPDMNTRSAYGKGTYIALMADYSKNYAQTDESDVSYMFYCKYAYSKLECNMKDKSRKDDPFIAGCDKTRRILVFPNKNAVIPVYLVAFHKNAK